MPSKLGVWDALQFLYLGAAIVLASCSSASDTDKIGITYLECKMLPSGGGMKSVTLELNLNEPAGTAGVTLRETGWSFAKVKAHFSPAGVTFNAPASTFSDSKHLFTVNRMTLEISENIIEMDQSFQRKGQCSPVKIDGRKF